MEAVAAGRFGIERGDGGVRVRCREAGREKAREADWLVSAMSLVKLREVPVTPPWPEGRAQVVKGFPCYTASQPVFQSRTRFWETDGVSANIVLGETAPASMGVRESAKGYHRRQHHAAA